jgi:hypothetical protein
MMEALWDDLTHDSVALQSPEWHLQALKQAELSYADHQSDFISWEVAKKKIKDKYCRFATTINHDPIHSTPASPQRR